MAPINLPNYNKWTRPPTAVYEDNYGYGINFYQPMIDYISAKEYGFNIKPPHLPWNNERGLERYRYDRPVKTYSHADLTRIAKCISQQAKEDLNHFEICRRTPFSVCATASAANIVKHVVVESVTDKARKMKALHEKIKAERRQKRMDEIKKELDLYEAEVNVGRELKRKAAIYRGKSAKAIAQTLLKESRENFAEHRLNRLRSRRIYYAIR